MPAPPPVHIECAALHEILSPALVGAEKEIAANIHLAAGLTEDALGQGIGRSLGDPELVNRQFAPAQVVFARRRSGRGSTQGNPEDSGRHVARCLVHDGLVIISHWLAIIPAANLESGCTQIQISGDVQRGQGCRCLVNPDIEDLVARTIDRHILGQVHDRARFADDRYIADTRQAA